MFSAKEKIQRLLDKAGVTINGPHDFDIQVHNEKLYGRVLLGGSLALGESYIDGWWDAKNLDQFFHNILSAGLSEEFKLTWPTLLTFLKTYLFNLETPSRSFEVGQKHYDIGNDVYEAMLDKRLVYTCGYWAPSTDSTGSLQAGSGRGILVNAEMQLPDIKKYCSHDSQSQDLLKKYVDSSKLSARGYHRVLKVARTIADLEESEHIEHKHIAEALMYRLKD